MRTANVPKAAEAISSTTIYEHPSIEKLAEFIAGVAKDPAGYVKTNDSQIADMELMVKKYSNGLDVPLSRITGSTGDRMTILLTGSTGSLGAHILAALLQDSAVNKVYVLNRPSLDSKTVQQRQVERFKDKSLELSLLSNDNLVYLEGETSHHNLGLEEDVYNEVCIFLQGVRIYLNSDSIQVTSERKRYHPQRLESRFQPFALVLRVQRSGNAQPD